MLRKITDCSVAVKYRDWFLCFVSAIILILPFTTFGLWFFAWFGFIPFFTAIKNKNKFYTFLLAYFTGVVFWLGTIYWLSHVTVMGTVILVLYLSLYFGLFGLLIGSHMAIPRKRILFFVPAVWVLLEFARSYLLTGFPWALLGYSQTSNLPIIQIADITGTYGVSFLIVMVNVALYSKKRIMPALLCCVIVASYGFYKLYWPDRNKDIVKYKVSVVQGNIPQQMKWDERARGYIINKYLELTHKAEGDGPDLIVWPEASWPFLLNDNDINLAEGMDFLSGLKSSLVFGAVTMRGGFYYNSALFYRKGLKTPGIYDKLHLVPFGEYIPLKKIFPFLETIAPIGDITKGNKYTVFSDRNDFSVLVCFEDLFPELSRRFVRKGASFLVNITNDAWYGNTTAAYQHLQASIMRAVENRVWVVRSANTGISAFINSKGKIISLVSDRCRGSLFVDGVATSSVNIMAGKYKTFYTYTGDLFVLFSLLYLVIFLKKRN